MTAKLEIKANMNGGYSVVWEDIPVSQQGYYPIVKRGENLYYGQQLNYDDMGMGGSGTDYSSGVCYSSYLPICSGDHFAESATYDLYLSPASDSITDAVSYGTNIADKYYNKVKTVGWSVEMVRYNSTYYNGDLVASHGGSDIAIYGQYHAVKPDGTSADTPSRGYAKHYYTRNLPSELIGSTTVPTNYIAYKETYDTAVFLNNPSQSVYLSSYCYEDGVVYDSNYDNTTGELNYIVKITPRVNLAPTDMTLSESTLQKVAGRTAPYIIGDLTVTDPNTGDVHSFEVTGQTLSGVPENVLFVGCGKLLAFGTVEAGTHTVIIKASDGISTYTKTFTITVAGASAGSLTSPADFTATAASANTINLSFTLPTGILSDATIAWQRSSVDPESNDFDPATDWATIATTDIYGNQTT